MNLLGKFYSRLKIIKAYDDHFNIFDENKNPNNIISNFFNNFERQD